NDPKSSQKPQWGKLSSRALNRGDFVFRVPGLYQAILEERFNNNEKHWLMFSNDSEARAEVNEGYYFMGSKVNEWHFSTIPVALNQSSDFQIQCTVKKLNGVDNYFFGLIWGFKDSKNFYNLDITGDGRVAVTRKQ